MLFPDTALSYPSRIILGAAVVFSLILEEAASVHTLADGSIGFWFQASVFSGTTG